MKQDMAEAGALRALGWLAGQEDLMPVFLGATGATPEDVRAQAADPEFLASVLDFLLMDDAWVVACADGTGIPAQDFTVMRQLLPGGDLPNWT